jgi:PEP-CTERM motif
MKCFTMRIGAHVLFCFAAALPVCGTVINFEAQAANTGGNLTGIPDSPLTIGIATFTGGELRDGEVGLNADKTGVYASEGLFGSGETNPLVITFASPVSDFSVFVANADGAGSYTVSDNLGDSVTGLLASIGASGEDTFSLSGNGLTKVDITSFDADSWNFAIDNVTFATSISTPEPESLLLVGVGVILLAAIRYRQPRARYAVSLSSAPLAARDSRESFRNSPV